MRGEVVGLTAGEATEFLLPRHYSGRVPSISRAFGWKVDGKLQAVCTFGKPASHSLMRRHLREGKSRTGLRVEQALPGR